MFSKHWALNSTVILKTYSLFCHISALLAFTFLWQLFIWEAEQVYSHHSLIHSWAVKKHNLGKNAISLLHKVSFLYLDISSDLIGWISHHLKQEGRNVWYVQIVILKVFLLSAPKWLHFILKFLVCFLCMIVKSALKYHCTESSERQ